MNKFNILAKEFDLSHHYLIEASAGTGKTFSIENIFLRLVVEGDAPLESSQILAVTFTRAAVSDLKHRIRATLKVVLKACDVFLKSGVMGAMPEFLAKIFNEGRESVERLKTRVDSCLSHFDQARIYTIHAFCAKMLSENVLEANCFISSPDDQNELSSRYLAGVAKDFLRTELKKDLISSTQLKIALNYSKGFDGLVKKLSFSITSLMRIESPLSFSEAFGLFKEGIFKLKISQSIDPLRLRDDFHLLAPHYTGVVNKQKIISEEILKDLKEFVGLFEKDFLSFKDFDFLIRTKGFWNEVLAKKKKSFPKLSLNYPEFGEAYQKMVGEIASAASNPEAIIAILTSRCQLMGQRVLAESDLIDCNSLLHAMTTACEKEAFVHLIRSQFKAVIIDEFQDTDPWQWKIFSKLFPIEDLSWGRLFLVGDPKQSIYSFRQADIYTYLFAAHAMGERAKFFLDHNYRSESRLISALNAVFDPAFAPEFIQLPRTKSSLEYHFVKAGGKIKDLDLDDGRGHLQFSLYETKAYSIEEVEALIFPFIASEITSLRMQKGLVLSQFAVLIADKYQGDRLIKYLQSKDIAAVSLRGSSLASSRVVKALCEVLEAIINPRDESRLKIALGGPLICWSHLDVQRLNSLEKNQLPHVLLKFSQLRKVLYTQGVASFLKSFMATCWKDDQRSVKERLLSQEDAESFFNEWEQLSSLLIEKHSLRKVFPEELIDDLLEVQNADEEQADLKVQPAESENAVQILTIHSSKGLEFDIVFAIGLLKRSPKASTSIPVLKQDGEYVQRVVDVLSEEYLKHCEEVDAEKARQFYVALTRAKHKLYVPAVFTETTATFGTASPMELYIARCGGQVQSYAELYERINESSASHFESKLKSLGSALSIGISQAHAEGQAAFSKAEKPFFELVRPASFKVPGALRFLKSYSALAESKVFVPDTVERKPPRDYLTNEKSSHTLPACRETGICLHAILEKISFAFVKEASHPLELLSFIGPFLKGSSFEGWESVFAEIVYYALKTPLFKDVPSLSEISDLDCYKEVEFLFPAHLKMGFNGHLKGVIDLLFRYRDKYYIVDWKSNWLGLSLDYYGEESARAAMQEHDYFLQARIYKDAVLKYLNLIQEGSFGGAAYVFLRGFDKEKKRGHEWICTATID